MRSTPCWLSEPAATTDSVTALDMAVLRHVGLSLFLALTILFLGMAVARPGSGPDSVTDPAGHMAAISAALAPALAAQATAPLDTPSHGLTLPLGSAALPLAGITASLWLATGNAPQSLTIALPVGPRPRPALVWMAP